MIFASRIIVASTTSATLLLFADSDPASLTGVVQIITQGGAMALLVYIATQAPKWIERIMESRTKERDSDRAACAEQTKENRIFIVAAIERQTEILSAAISRSCKHQ